MRAEMVRAYVESLLEELTSADKVTPDHDGDYPVRVGDSLYFVRLIGDVNPVVQVFSTAVKGVPNTPELCSELNDINSRIRFARIFWVGDQVLVEADLVGQTLDPEEFGSACNAVATITDHFAPLLASTFGGTTSSPAEKTGAAEAPEKLASTGLYL